SISAQAFGSGNAGTIIVNAPLIDMAGHSQITGSSTGLGKAGAVALSARDLLMSGSTSSTFAVKGPDPASARDRNSTIDASDRVLLDQHSSITASVGTGLGGSISISNPDAIVLRDGSQILAKTEEGQGGRISITTQGLFVSPDSLISADAGIGTPGSV